MDFGLTKRQAGVGVHWNGCFRPGFTFLGGRPCRAKQGLLAMHHGRASGGPAINPAHPAADWGAWCIVGTQHMFVDCLRAMKPKWLLLVLLGTTADA